MDTMNLTLSLLSIVLLLFCIYYRGICKKQNRMINGYAKKLARAEECIQRNGKTLVGVREIAKLVIERTYS